MPNVISGSDLIEKLGKSGSALNAKCQALVAASGSDGCARHLLDCFHGRCKKWPVVPPAAMTLRANVVREWTALTVEIREAARQLVASNTGGSETDYDGYLRRVVLSKLTLEETTIPAQLARPAASSLVSDNDVAALHADGIVVISNQRVLAASALDVVRLRAEFALLHNHGVITPSVSSCNVGAHGVNLRCGTAEERANYAKQRTPCLLSAMDLLRALPHALEQHGYRFLDGAEALAVPSVCLVSAYPPGEAQYKRHLGILYGRRALF